MIRLLWIPPAALNAKAADVQNLKLYRKLKADLGITKKSGDLMLAACIV